MDIPTRRGARISDRRGRQGIDDLIWDRDERFLTYASTYLQLFKMFIAILCLNGVEQPFKGHQCPFFLSMRRRKPRLRCGSLCPRGGSRTSIYLYIPNNQSCNSKTFAQSNLLLQRTYNAGTSGAYTNYQGIIGADQVVLT